MHHSLEFKTDLNKDKENTCFSLFIYLIHIYIKAIFTYKY